MLEPIPAPLRDRMEVIRLSGYTPEEKMRDHDELLDPAPDRRTRHDRGAQSAGHAERGGLVLVFGVHLRGRGSKSRTPVSPRSVARWRAGARKAKKVEGARQRRRCSIKFLGPPPFQVKTMASAEQAEIGLVNGSGLDRSRRRSAFAGGQSLPRASGLVLTGQLGDVMKESGQTALSYVRSILERA